MSTHIKTLGIALLVTVVMSATAAGHASALTSGHFTSDVSHTSWAGTENESHRTKWSFDGGTPIQCLTSSYSGTTTSTTVTSLTVAPAYPGCETEGGSGLEIKIFVGTCNYVFQSSSSPLLDATFAVECPKEASVQISHPNCTILVPGQSLRGAYYTTTTQGLKHALTIDMTVSGITAHYEAGVCVFLGTTHTATLTGSIVLTGSNTAGEKVNVTAT